MSVCEPVQRENALSPLLASFLQHPPHPPTLRLSLVWASDWGPWAQSPRKLHQSKQRDGLELREYRNTKGQLSTEEDFSSASNKGEPLLHSEARVNAACCASLTTPLLGAQSPTLQSSALHKPRAFQFNPSADFSHLDLHYSHMQITSLEMWLV